MDKKLILGVLGGAATGFLLSFVIFGLLMAGSAEEWRAQFGDCLKEDSMTPWIVYSLLMGLFLTLLLDKLGARTFLSGVKTAAWIMVLFSLINGIGAAATYTAYPWEWMPYDIVTSVVISSVAGGVIGWILGKNS